MSKLQYEVRSAGLFQTFMAGSLEEAAIHLCCTGPRFFRNGAAVVAASVCTGPSETHDVTKQLGAALDRCSTTADGRITCGAYSAPIVADMWWRVGREEVAMVRDVIKAATRASAVPMHAPDPVAGTCDRVDAATEAERAEEAAQATTDRREAAKKELAKRVNEAFDEQAMPHAASGHAKLLEEVQLARQRVTRLTDELAEERGAATKARHLLNVQDMELVRLRKEAKAHKEQRARMDATAQRQVREVEALRNTISDCHSKIYHLDRAPGTARRESTPTDVNGWWGRVAEALAPINHAVTGAAQAGPGPCRDLAYLLRLAADRAVPPLIWYHHGDTSRAQADADLRYVRAIKALRRVYAHGADGCTTKRKQTEKVRDVYKDQASRLCQWLEILLGSHHPRTYDPNGEIAANLRGMASRFEEQDLTPRT